MEMIALLLGVFLGAKCHVPLNALFAALDWGLGLYGLLAALLIHTLGDFRGILLTVGLPALYFGYRGLRAWEQRFPLGAAGPPPAAAPPPYPMAMNGQGLVYVPQPYPMPVPLASRRRRRPERADSDPRPPLGLAPEPPAENAG
jgi:hypothetical protein